MGSEDADRTRGPAATPTPSPSALIALPGAHGHSLCPLHLQHKGALSDSALRWGPWGVGSGAGCWHPERIASVPSQSRAVAISALILHPTEARLGSAPGSMARCRMAKPIPGGATTKRTLRPRRDPAATQRRRGRSMASGLVWEQAWTGDGHAWGRARVGMGAWRRHTWRWERGGGTRGSGSGWEWVRVAQLGGCAARWVRPLWGFSAPLGCCCGFGALGVPGLCQLWGSPRLGTEVVAQCGAASPWDVWLLGTQFGVSRCALECCSVGCLWGHPAPWGRSGDTWPLGDTLRGAWEIDCGVMLSWMQWGHAALRGHAGDICVSGEAL